MPPHWLHAGPRSRPARRAGTTGGLSVMASAAARVVAGCEPATVGVPGVPAAAWGAPPAAGADGVAAGGAEAGAPAAPRPAAGVAPPVLAPAAVLAPPLPPFDGLAVSDAIDVAASSAILRARTSGVRMPSSSWVSVSRKREASQRMM